MKQLILGLTLFGAGIFSGMIVSDMFENRSGTARQGQEEHSPSDESPRPRSNRKASANDIITAQSNKPFAKLLDQAFAEQSEIRGTRFLMRGLEQHHSETAPAFASYFSKRPFSKNDFHYWRLFFSSWGSFDGTAALAYIRERFDQATLQQEFYFSVLRSWDKEQPGKALEQAGDFLVATPGPAGELAKDFIWDLMLEDPAKGLRKMVMLTEAEALMEMSGMQIKTLAKRNLKSALELLDTMAEGETKLFLTGQLLQAWSNSDPIAAAKWMTQQGNPQISPGDLQALAANFIKTDARAAFEWINQLPDGLYNEALLSKSSKAWAQADLPSVKDWLDSHAASTESDPVVISVTETLARENPAHALEVASNLIHDPAKSQETFFGLAMEWQKAEPAAFRSWLQNTTSVRPEQKQRLLNYEFHGNQGRDSTPATRNGTLDNGREGR